MKTGKAILALLLCTSILAAADAMSLLLRGGRTDPKTATASGSATAVFGSVSIQADSVTFIKELNVVRCSGAATIKSGGVIVSGRDCEVKLADTPRNVFLLGPDGINSVPGCEEGSGGSGS